MCSIGELGFGNHLCLSGHELVLKLEEYGFRKVLEILTVFCKRFDFSLKLSYQFCDGGFNRKNQFGCEGFFCRCDGIKIFVRQMV